MELMNIVLICLVVLLLLYIILNWVYSSSTQLTHKYNGSKQQIILASTLPTSSNSSNYTYSTWFYVNDWNYRFGEPKILLGRHDSEKHPSPSIVFGAMENDINISVACYSDNKAVDGKYKIHTCNVKNFPLQKWVNLTYVLNNRSVDIYVNGKLDGSFKEYYENGQLWRECTFVNGKRHGKDILYDLDPSGTSPNENLPRIKLEKSYIQIYHSQGHRTYRIDASFMMDGQRQGFTGRGLRASSFSNELKNYSISNIGVSGQFSSLAEFAQQELADFIGTVKFSKKGPNGEEIPTGAPRKSDLAAGDVMVSFGRM